MTPSTAEAAFGGAAWAGAPEAAPRRKVAWAVGGGHLLLAWLLAQTLTPNAPPSRAETTSAPRFWLLAPREPQRSPASSTALSPSAARPAPPQPSVSPLNLPSPTANRAPLRLPPADAGPTDGAITLSLPAAELPTRPASAPLPRLLDTEATRQAIRDAARQPLLSERAARAMDLEPTTDAQRLSAAAAAAAQGDCVKGEFAGGGMGVLSLPFLALAVARGACAK